MDISSKSAPWNTAWNNILSTDGATVRDQQNQGMFSYTQMPVKFENPQQQRNALGLVGGSEVSVISGSLVDLESELYGRTRTASKCVARHYIPSCPLGGSNCPDTPPSFSFFDKATGAKTTVDTTRKDLPTGQFVSYPGVKFPSALNTSTCYPQRF
jgi:hypothetical protein